MMESREWNVFGCTLPSQVHGAQSGSDSRNLSCRGLVPPWQCLLHADLCHPLGRDPAMLVVPWNFCSGSMVWRETTIPLQGRAQSVGKWAQDDVPSQMIVIPRRSSNSRPFPMSFSVFSVAIILLWEARVVLCLQ